MALDYLIFKHKDLEVRLPEKLKHIFEEIKGSKQILDLKENWDDEGALPIDYNLWKNSIEFLSNYSNLIHNKYNVVIDAPQIFTGPDGSIDLSFRYKKEVRMLINISNKNDNIVASYYGDCYNDKNKIKNKEQSLERLDKRLLIWMKNYLKIN